MANEDDMLSLRSLSGQDLVEHQKAALEAREKWNKQQRAKPPRSGHLGAEPSRTRASSWLAGGVLPVLSGASGRRAEDVSNLGSSGSGRPAGTSTAGFGGDGLLVVGLDITPGVYRTPGPAGQRSGSFALLKSTSTRDVADFSSVKGPTTVTVGPSVKAVKVSGCQPWQRLGDTLDAVIARDTTHVSPTDRSDRNQDQADQGRQP
jgi:hypothetical protein